MATQVAYFVPTQWWVERLEAGKWVHSGKYETREKAEHRAKDLAQFYGHHARVMEAPKTSTTP